MTNDVSTPLQKPTDADTEYMMYQFMIKMRLLDVRTITLVKVIAVHNGGVAFGGTVDVLPLIDEKNGAGKAIPNETLFGRPYVRVQGGAVALIVDPAPGDVGVMVFGARDLSAVLATGKEGPPPSNRRFNYADGLYLFSIPRQNPTAYIQVTPDGNIVMRANSVDINGATISSSGEVTDAAGKVLGTHEHGPGTYTAPSSGGPISGDSGTPI